jgi:hypothetical protein
MGPVAECRAAAAKSADCLRWPGGESARRLERRPTASRSRSTAEPNRASRRILDEVLLLLQLAEHGSYSTIFN